MRAACSKRALEGNRVGQLKYRQLGCVLEVRAVEWVSSQIGSRVDQLKYRQ
jgi:hypothetical protein